LTGEKPYIFTPAQVQAIPAIAEVIHQSGIRKRDYLLRGTL